MDCKIDDVITKGDVLSGHRSLVKASAYRFDFCSKFSLPYAEGHIPDSIPGLIRQIDLYIVDVILGIAYYTTRIRKARKERNAYIILSISLILAIPIFLSLLSRMHLGAAGPTVVAQITGGLTAIAGLQKAFGAWAAANQRYVIWRSTSAKLKTLWYGLQTKWPNPPGCVDQSKFLDDLVAGQRSARATIDAEQDDYFQSLAQLPTIDILGTLGCAMANPVVTSLVPSTSTLLASGSAAAKRSGDVAQAQAEIAKNIAIIEAQKDLVTEKTSELPGADAAAVTALQASIASSRAAMTTAETALVSARATLAVIQAPLP